MGSLVRAQEGEQSKRFLEAIRAYGQQRLATAMLSRSLAGQMGKTLVLALPGSPSGAAEGMDAVFPALLHAFSVLEGARHSE